MASAQIDYRKASMAEADRSVDKHTSAVWPAVRQAVTHAREQRLVNCPAGT
jgi:hypothetical protein